MEKQFSFYDSEVSKLSMSGKTYWSEKPDLTLPIFIDFFFLRNSIWCPCLIWRKQIGLPEILFICWARKRIPSVFKSSKIVKCSTLIFRFYFLWTKLIKSSLFKYFPCIFGMLIRTRNTLLLLSIYDSNESTDFVHGKSNFFQ
jgi:hypothetical protein